MGMGMKRLEWCQKRDLTAERPYLTPSTLSGRHNYTVPCPKLFAVASLGTMS